ncbi:hypothetical protein LINPERHAP2_LOCUS21209 [Linum perenne]
MVPRRCDGELKTDQLMLSFYISPRPKVPTTITFNFIVPYIHTYTFIFWRFMHGFLFENQPRLGIYHQEVHLPCFLHSAKGGIHISKWGRPTKVEIT